jgi:hypothetical protein
VKPRGIGGLRRPDVNEDKHKKLFATIVGSTTAVLAGTCLAVFAFVAFKAYGVATQGADPARNAATAAEIADFRVPPGYRLLTALDLSLVKMAIVAPQEKAKRGFVMELEGMSISTAGQTDEDIVRKLQQGLGYGSQCTTLQTTGQDRVTTASGKTLVLSMLRCTSQQPSNIIEFGRIPAKLPSSIFMAEGPPHLFDHAAVRALLQSLH